MANGTIKQVKEYFGMNLAEMKAEWTGTGQPDNKRLTPLDKEQIQAGIGNGTFTY